jgi:site-specific DNA recombinase
LRDKSEWVQIEAPNLRIIDEDLWDAVQAEMLRRARPSSNAEVAGRRRQRHLLSGLIKCSVCGSNYVISGKDYYRCAGAKERGTCANNVSLRKTAIEPAALRALQMELLTSEHARLFASEFRREIKLLASAQVDHNEGLRERLSEVQDELRNLERNLLAGVLSPTLSRMLSEREAEKGDIEARLAVAPEAQPQVALPSASALMKGFESKVANLYAALNDEEHRAEAAAIINRLIASVTIFPDGENGPEAEVEASAGTLLRFAANENSRRPFKDDGSSITVVAGTGFEPVTFRL